ncbi:MAG: DNA methyltransferase [Bacteroidetes bacterium]|nr:MAG: DNA methyltransferase [Bacteroidota bacterium]
MPKKRKKYKLKKKDNVVKEFQEKYIISPSNGSKRYIDETWDFRKENTKEYTHCFHAYPAMMIPQIARRIIATYGKKAKLLFDPYCGTGTSLVEANIVDIDAIGTDLNPLARLIAETKTTSLNIQTLDLYLKDFTDKVFAFRFGKRDIHSIVLPDFKNIDFWFSKTIQRQLALIKKYIEKISDVPIQNFFKVAFSETIRECSYTKNGEFKLVRMTEDRIKKFKPDVLGIIEYKLSRNRNGLISYLKTKKNGAFARIHQFNSVEGIPKNIFLLEGNADIVVTSPPYGDSRTTVAYGQFSRLANQWLDYSGASQVDNILMGGVRNGVNYHFKSSALNETIEKINKQDENRCKDVTSFFYDYQKSIANVSSVLKHGGHACYVVGNRTVKGVNIPMDEITKQIFQENDLKHIETIIRNIPNKRMPLENSPTNVTGEKSTTMRNEFIVVCQKK